MKKKWLALAVVIGIALALVLNISICKDNDIVYIGVMNDVYAIGGGRFLGKVQEVYEDNKGMVYIATEDDVYALKDGKYIGVMLDSIYPPEPLEVPRHTPKDPAIAGAPPATDNFNPDSI